MAKLKHLNPLTPSVIKKLKRLKEKMGNRQFKNIKIVRENFTYNTKIVDIWINKANCWNSKDVITIMKISNEIWKRLHNPSNDI